MADLVVMGKSTAEINLMRRTLQWQDVPKIDDRPVAYVAAGSHGVYSFPGHHVYANVRPNFRALHTFNFDEQILGVIQLVDETDDTGPIWDTKSTVVPIQWWHGPENGTLVYHAGSLGWMNFIGRWGNIGDRGFLYKVGAASHVIDGPTGPNRDFRGNTNVSLGFGQPADDSVRWEKSHQIRLAQRIRSS
jgi:hypothetical protein